MADRKYAPTRIEAVCQQCGVAFAYMHATGTNRRHCSDRCRVKWRDDQRKVRRSAAPICKIDGCSGHASRIAAGMCEKHYSRARRGKPMQDKVPAYRYTTQAGYVAVLVPGHPLAMKSGRVHEHRLVAFEKNDGICPGCFWCGIALAWPYAVIDHLDEDKANNDPPNLVVACSPCNRARGAMLAFLSGLTDAALPIFLEQIVQYRSRQREAGAKQREEAGNAR